MVLNRATSVYAIMILIFGAGLWVILEFGSGLKAPLDLAGDWESSEGQKMTIEQSGRFFVISPDRGAKLDLKLRDQRTLDDQQPPQIRVTLADETGSTVVVQGPPRGDEYRFDIQGSASSQSFVARRVRRAYGSPVATTQPNASPTHARS